MIVRDERRQVRPSDAWARFQMLFEVVRVNIDEPGEQKITLKIGGGPDRAASDIHAGDPIADDLDRAAED